MNKHEKLRGLFQKITEKFDVKKENPPPSRKPIIDEIRRELQQAKEEENTRRAAEIDKAARELLLERYKFDYTPPGVDKKPRTAKVMEQAEHIVDHAQFQKTSETEQVYAEQLQNLENVGRAAPDVEQSQAPDLSSTSLSSVFNYEGKDGADRGR